MAFTPVSSLTVEGLNKFLSMNYHYPIKKAIYTFADLRIADRLVHAEVDRGLTVEEIIGDDREQWNSQLLLRIIRACASGGIVKQVNDDKHFILTPSGMMMTSDHPSHVRDHVLFFFGPLVNSAFEHLPNLVRGEGTSSGVARVSNGLDFHTLLSEPNEKELYSIFSGAITALSMQTGANLINGVDFSRFKTIVDVGGNCGTFLAQIIHAYPMVQYGIVFDFPRIVDQHKVEEEFTSRGISNDRWSFVASDMFDPSTIPLADAYVLKHILHNYDDENCSKILSSIQQAIKDNKETSTTIFIIDDIILSDEAVGNWQAHSMDMTMAAVFGSARERTESELIELLEKGSLKLTKLYPVQTPESVLEAELS